MSSINRNAAQQMATILSNKRVGSYHQILIGVGDLVKSCRPGNFVAMSVGGDSSRMILRRAFAISRVSDSSQYGGTMELIVAPHGSGSKWLCSLPEGSEVDIVAPLGTAFGIPTEPINALLIGGGYGSAPLFGLADVLKNRNRNIDVIYSCGPMGMLRAITELVAETDVIHQCAVEESMACGIGICMTCVLPVIGDDGSVSMLRSCIDGPVMDGSRVKWDLVGQVPEAQG